MGKVVDKLLLFLFSLLISISCVILILYAFGLIGNDVFDWLAWEELGHSVENTTVLIVVSFLVLLISLRMFVISIRPAKNNMPSIDQRTNFGDIKISLETVENLTLKAAARQKGVKDLKARVSVTEAGIELTIRAVVDGDTPIPDLSEEMQRTVKEHVEDITGIPVTSVTVYVANVASTHSFRSRVD